MIREIETNPALSSKVCGIVNLNIQQGAGKANYQTYGDISQEFQIPLHYCQNVNDQETLDWIQKQAPDLIIQTGWSQKFHAELLRIPRFGCIGEHPAPLPKGRGAACVNWAILTGETSWGDTFFQMVEEYDKGVMYAQSFFEIASYDTVKTVYDKVALASANMIRDHIDQWTEGIFQPIIQDDSSATYYKRRRPEDGLFDFTMKAKQAHDFIRAQTHPYPGAFFMEKGRPVKVYLSSLTENRVLSADPGTIAGVYSDGSIGVVCGDGAILRVYRVEPAGSVEQWASDWIAGAGLTKL